VVGALASIGRDWWWIGLIVGVLELLLGIWAAGYPGRSLFVFVNLVGIYAMFYGFGEIFAAFDLRRLDHTLDRATDRPAVYGGAAASEEVELAGATDGVPAPVGVELAVDALDVGLDGIHGHVQLGGDLAGRQHARQVAQHHVLPLAERLHQHRQRGR
jgi:hypothetical protein